MAGVWAKRVGVGVGVVVLVAGGFAAWNWNGISARMTAAKLRSATSDDARVELADKLIAAGEPGVTQLVEVLRAGTPEQCSAVVMAVSQHVKDLPPDDPKCVSVCQPILAACESFGDAGTMAVLDLIPELSRQDAEACRTLIRAGLKSSDGTARLRAIRLAAAPQFGLKKEVVPLLDDPTAEVRRAAMAAVGPLGIGEPVIEADDLFRWLNDPDAEVRMVCEAALSTRGLEPDLIDAGRKLTHPEAAERLTLLVDIQRRKTGVFRTPGPWLERLSRDTDPAVRAATAGVAYECRLAFAGWLDRLVDDPDPTVRQIAGYHRRRAEQFQQTGFTGR